jgi:hypothetical protein
MAGGEVEALLDLCASGAADALVLDHLDRAVGELIDHDLVHRLVPFAHRLRSVDYSSAPMAALPAAVAICAIDRSQGRQMLRTARRQLEASGNERGIGYAYFLEGLEDLGEGKLAQAQRWWSMARPLLGTVVAARLAGLHLALGAFHGGDVTKAVLLAEQALWIAEDANDKRTEGAACVYLAYFHLATGRFSLVDYHVDRGNRVFQHLADRDRYEMPLLHLLRAALCTMRGDHAAEHHYAEALRDADRRGNQWYSAIVRATRSEWTAAQNPSRAIEDARMALSYLDKINEEWWSRSARIAYATAHLRAGNFHAGRAACETLSGLNLNDLDRGRCQIVAAAIAANLGDPRAVALAQEGVRLLTEAGAAYWAAIGDMTLTIIDPSRREFHRRRAEKRAGLDAADAGWRNVLRGPGRLRIDIFGGCQVRVGDQFVTFATRAEVEFVGMIAAEPNGLPREVISDRLWPNDDARLVAHRLDNLVSSVRRALAPTTRLRRRHGLLTLELLPGECDARDAIVAAHEDIRHRTLEPDHRHEIARLLRQPIMPGRPAPWIGALEFELDQLARRLEQTREVRSVR